MTTERKLKLLGEEAQYDLACACGMNGPRQAGTDGRWIYPAVMPDGRITTMLKVLLNNACENDCAYCAQRASRPAERTCFEPLELARLFDQLARAGKVQALFLSSGLGGNARRTMDQMIGAVELIRRRFGFRGFVHLKILPGADESQVEQAAKVAQRISINLEAPTAERLAALSGKKVFQEDIFRRMAWIARAVAERRGLAKGHTTQFVVGPAGETDAEIVGCADRLYREYRLSRAYYSAFQPVPQTPLSDHPPTPLLREHRLYQADFLLRKYKFQSKEIPFGPAGNLSLERDPKTLWAEQHPERFPVEVNRAERDELLRVPGLGPISVDRILKARAEGTLRDIRDLRKLGAPVRKAAPFLLLDGSEARRQLRLFE